MTMCYFLKHFVLIYPFLGIGFALSAAYANFVVVVMHVVITERDSEIIIYTHTYMICSIQQKYVWFSIG